MNDRIDDRAIDSVRRECGAEVLDRLIHHYGGRRIFIPTKAATTARLAKHFDQPTLEKLCAAVGGDSILIPLGPRSASQRARIRVQELTLQGCSANDTAREAGCSLRTVFNVRAEMREAGALPQGDAA